MKKLNVGIMSMQRISNYGSFMQAYALKKIIESLGCEVQFVDYRKEEPLIKDEKSTKLRKIIKVFGGNARLTHKIQYILHKKHFSKYQEVLGLSKIPNYSPKLDTLVIGSDEVFNLIQSNDNVGYSLELLGKNNNAKKTISYAASFGNTTLDKIEKYNKTADFIKYLRELDAISVRDKNSEKIIQRLTGQKPSLNLDPVLIYDFTQDKNFSIERRVKERYMILYAYNNRLSKKEAKLIKDFAERRKLKLYSIGGAQPYADSFIDCTPFEIMSWFKNADYIVTDTFHGSIFSIINHRPFATVIRKSENNSYGNEEKILSLLSMLKQQERGFYRIEDLLIKKDIDYSETDELLSREREKAVKYLRRNIK